MENTKVGPFLILKRLGKGRRPQVYHARQEAQNKDVVLKFIKFPETVAWTTAIDKIHREANELCKLRHDNLVRMYGAGVHETEKKIFFASELVEGEALSSILARRGKLTPDLVVEYGHQAAEALKYIHNKEIIHSKLTPEKIIVSADHKIKITDVRLNRVKKRRWDATRRRDLEIAAYMAPEQFEDGATQKSDFYSLGVILYEMLTGKLPYEPDTMGRIAKVKKEAEVPSISQEVMNCPIWLDKIVTQMLQPDPRQRPHSARAITFAFEEIKKIDSTRKSAVSQVTGGFNPLTVGTDKTEANRLLGKKPKIKRENLTPFYQRTPFMVVCLVAIMSLLIYKAIPKSEAARLEMYREYIETKDPSKWSEANSRLVALMGSADSEISETATELYFQNREQMLEATAKRGSTVGARNLRSDNFNAYIDAVQLVLKGESFQASQAFQQLVLTVDPEGDERHIYRASTKRLQALANTTAVPTDQQTLMSMIDSYRWTTNQLELLQGEKVLGRIIIQFADSVPHTEVCAAAKAQLMVVRERLQRLQQGLPAIDDSLETEAEAS